MNDAKQTILDTRAKMESMDYDEWVKAMEKANAPVLKKFKAWLTEAGLAAKTIARHVNNVDLFVNVYQTHYDYCGTMFDGWSDFDDFIGYWFVRKCLWSSESSIRGLVASLKKFYFFLALEGYITPDEAAEARLNLKDGLEGWVEEVREFDDFGGGDDWDA